MDGFASALPAWVGQGCTPAAWAGLLALAGAPGAPPLLDRAALSGIDDLEHRILCVLAAHACSLRMDRASCPFPSRGGVTGGELLALLPLPTPGGLVEPSRRLHPTGRLLRAGLLDDPGGCRRREAGAGNLGELQRPRLVLPLEAPSPAEPCLPRAARRQVEELLEHPSALDAPFRILLLGPAGSGRRTLARRLAGHFGFPLEEVDACTPPGPGCMALWQPGRRAALEDGAHALGHPGWAFLVPGEGCALDLRAHADLVLDLGAFGTTELAQYWHARVSQGPLRGAEVLWTPLADSGFGPGRIRMAVKWAEGALAEGDGRSPAELLAASIRVPAPEASTLWEGPGPSWDLQGTDPGSPALHARLTQYSCAQASPGRGALPGTGRAGPAKESRMAEFARCLSREGMAALAKLSGAPGGNIVKDLLELWAPSGEPGGPHALRLAIRDGYLNFYRKGQSIAEMHFPCGRPVIRIHVKFVWDGLGKRQAVASLDCLEENPRMVAEDGTWVPYLGMATLREWIARSAQYTKPEKRGLDAIVGRHRGVIDLETALSEFDGGTAPRVDMVSVWRTETLITLLFWEAKCLKNPELRAANGPPDILGQLERYRAYVADEGRRAVVIAAYREACRLMAEFCRMAGRTDTPFARLVEAVASARVPLVLDGEPRLLLFVGRDKSGRPEPASSNWEPHRHKLKKAKVRGLEVDDPADIRLTLHAPILGWQAP